MFYKKATIAAIFLLAVIHFNPLFSQIGAVSSNFLSSYNAYTVPANILELEPTYNYSRSLGYYDLERKYKNRSGVDINSSLYFRATYGVSDILEIGAGLTTDLNALNLGAKLYLLGNDQVGFALIGGINSDITSGTRALSSLVRQYVFGVAGHYLFSDALSVNATWQLQDLRSYEGMDTFFNTEIGYYINENVIAIAGIGLSKYSNSDLPQSTLFSFFPGFAIERNHIIIVFQGQFDLAGENFASTNALSVSLTQLID